MKCIVRTIANVVLSEKDIYYEWFLVASSLPSQNISIRICLNTQHVVILALGWHKDKAQQQ